MFPYDLKTLVDAEGNGDYMPCGLTQACRDLDEVRYYIGLWFLKASKRERIRKIVVKYDDCFRVDESEVSSEGAYDIELKNGDDIDYVFDEWNRYAREQDIIPGSITELIPVA